MTLYRSILCAAAALMLAGCTAVGPDYTPPSAEALPAAWQQDAADAPAATPDQLATWWRALGDAQLDALIAQADAGNLDLRVALARMEAARAAVGVAGGQYAPQVGVGGSSIRSKTSQEVSAAVPPPQSRPDTIDSVGTAASWEIDLFGRISRSVEAASATYQATAEEVRAVRVALYAEIATGYVSLRTLQQRLAYAHANARSQAKMRDLVKVKFEAELISELDYQQAERNLAITRASIPALEADIDAALYRLAVLVGQPPGALDATLRQPGAIPTLPPGVIGVMPRDIVRQRPDIRAAERTLAAETARVGVAKADLYPRLTLDGNFAFSAASGSLLTYNAQGWAFGPTLSWNVFSGNRLQSQVKVQRAQTEAARAAYEATVLRALEEVEGALSSYVHEGQRLAQLERSVRAADRSVELATAAYDAGVADFQNVLDAQRTLFEQQDAKARSTGARVGAFVAITRAMGGGWTGPVGPATDTNAGTGKARWMDAMDAPRL